MLKFYVSGSPEGTSTYQVDWLSGIDHQRVNNIKECDVVVFTGGEDINPLLYKEPIGKWTHYNINRDAIEVEDYKQAQKLGKICIGICRGAQLACTLSGGRLIQDVSGHSGNHMVTFNDKSSCITSSIHHQMMFPYDLPNEDYELIAWSSKFQSKHYLNGFDQNIKLFEGFVEPEVIWFKKTNSFAVQGHPEMMGPDTIFSNTLTRYFNQLTQNKYVRNSLPMEA